MYGQPLHTQRNSSTPGFNATRVLQGYLSRNMTHTVLPKLAAWPWNNSNSPTEYCRPQKRVSKETTYISSPKDRKKLDNQPTSRGLILTRAQTWDKVFIPKGWSAQHNQRTGCPYPWKWWDTSVASLCKDSPMWIVLSQHWIHKNRGERSYQTQLMITTNRQFSWKQNAVGYL